MKEIIVHDQQEMDDILDDYKGKIIIIGKGIVVQGNRIVYLYDSSSAELWDNAKAELWGNASAELHDNAKAALHDNAKAYLWDNASAELYDNASVYLYGNASAELHDNAKAYLHDNAKAELWGNASAELHDNASVYLYGNASAELYGNASAELYGNASAELDGNASAELHGNAQVLDKSDSHSITLHGNARIVHLPKNISEYFDYYGVKHTKVTATLYKAVRKVDGKYISNFNESFEYVIGKCKSEKCDADITQTCSYGIHVAPLDWALRYGRDWDSLAILEVKTRIDDIVLPKDTDGKVRTSKVKVVREVPFEECGILGKIIARSQGRLL